MRMVFASRNEGKVKEIREMLDGTDIDLVSLKNYQNIPEIIEDGRTFCKTP